MGGLEPASWSAQDQHRQSGGAPFMNLSLPKRPHLESGALEPWWPRFPGPFLYHPGRRLVPAPLRAFVDFLDGMRAWA